MKSSLLLHSHRRNCIMPAAKAFVLLSALVAAIIPTADGFSLSPSISATRHHHHHHVVGGGGASTLISPLICNSKYHHQGGRHSTSLLFAADPFNNNNNDDESSIIEQTSSNSSTMYTPFNRPLLAAIDTTALIIFAAIGKSSHTTTGDIDIIAVLLTAFPFVTAWLLTSPITNVYSPDDTENTAGVNIPIYASGIPRRGDDDGDGDDGDGGSEGGGVDEDIGKNRYCGVDFISVMLTCDEMRKCPGGDDSECSGDDVCIELCNET